MATPEKQPGLPSIFVAPRTPPSRIFSAPATGSSLGKSGPLFRCFEQPAPLLSGSNGSTPSNRQQTPLYSSRLPSFLVSCDLRTPGVATGRQLRRLHAARGQAAAAQH